MKTVAIIQARMGSTRLPGKVMKQLCGKTVLAHVIFRVQACPLVDEVVVATTTLPSDDAIVTESEKCGAKWFRGSEEDVLERYYLTAKQYNADVIVRVTSDCPLCDPNVLTQMLDYFNKARIKGLKIDYLNNFLYRSYPRGLDAEIFTFKTLETAFSKGCQPDEREHVTPYIYKHPDLFSLHTQTNNEDFSNYRWTLDTPDDWKLIETIYLNLCHECEIFTTDQVLALFRSNPELLEINCHVKQKEIQT
jgi:spore coat polysaccharide biosynthesis protein SpsF